jgi:hypothetical protein
VTVGGPAALAEAELDERAWLSTTRAPGTGRPVLSTTVPLTEPSIVADQAAGYAPTQEIAQNKVMYFAGFMRSQ